MPTMLKNLRIRTIGSVDRPANPEAQVVLMKRAGDTADDLNKKRKGDPNVPTIEDILKGLSAEQQAVITALVAKAGQVDALTTTNADLTKKYNDLEEQVKKNAPAPSEEELLKSIPESFRNVVADLQKRAKEADDALQLEVQKREDAEFITKAASYKELAIDANKLGPILRNVSKALSAEDMATLEGIFKAADAAVAQGKLFEEVGKATPIIGGDSLTKLEKAAEEIRKSDSRLTVEQAFSKACENNPTLYVAYCNEQGGAK